MIAGVGIDIVDLERISRLLQRKKDRFLKRILHKREWDQLPESSDRLVAFVGGRFAVKEAVAKALGTGIGPKLSWTDIAVVRGANGEPRIEWESDVIRHFPLIKDAKTFVSISHEKKYAVAQVIIEGQSAYSDR
ncbi:MAG: holo-ACP synthase [Bacillaceae bacterium]|nr:holo-ACP synthase [Bacillaceae bacterium]